MIITVSSVYPTAHLNGLVFPFPGQTSSNTGWEIGPRVRAISVTDHLPQMMFVGQEPLLAHSEQKLHENQLNDRVLSRVLYYVDHYSRPSRREKAKESVFIIHYIKHWEKPVVRNGTLYRVSYD